MRVKEKGMKREGELGLGRFLESDFSLRESGRDKVGWDLGKLHVLLLLLPPRPSEFCEDKSRSKYVFFIQILDFGLEQISFSEIPYETLGIKTFLSLVICSTYIILSGNWTNFTF